jgi:hypothetical protein
MTCGVFLRFVDGLLPIEIAIKENATRANRFWLMR